MSKLRDIAVTVAAVAIVGWVAVDASVTLEQRGVASETRDVATEVHSLRLTLEGAAETDRSLRLLERLAVCDVSTTTARNAGNNANDNMFNSSGGRFWCDSVAVSEEVLAPIVEELNASRGENDLTLEDLNNALKRLGVRFVDN